MKNDLDITKPRYSEQILPVPISPLGLRCIEVPLCTAISRKVVEKTVHATIPKGNMGYDQYTVLDDCSCRTYFCCFPLALANIRPWPLLPFFEISLKNSELKTTHNTFRDCRVRLFMHNIIT